MGWFLWPAPVQDRVLAPPPRCSPDTQSPCQDVYRENSGEVQALDKMPGERRTRTYNSLYARTTQEAKAEASARSRPAHRPRGRPRRAVQSSVVPPPEEDRTTTTDDEDQQLAPRQEGMTLPLGGGGGFHFEHLIGIVLARVLAAPSAADPVSEEAGDSSQGRQVSFILHLFLFIC
jgi:hypothetical protein